MKLFNYQTFILTQIFEFQYSNSNWLDSKTHALNHYVILLQGNHTYISYSDFLVHFHPTVGHQIPMNKLCLHKYLWKQFSTGDDTGTLNSET